MCNELLLEGTPIPITIDMEKKAISKIRSGKVASPSAIVDEMIRAAGGTGSTILLPQLLYPLISLEKKGKLILYQSRSVVRPSVRASVHPSRFL